MTRAIVFGGYGVFGTHVVAELAARGVAVTVAGRDGARAQAAAARLGSAHRAVTADVTRLDGLAAIVAGHAVAINCAGPFFAVGAALPEACLRAGVAYADIAEDRAHCERVRALDGHLRAAGLAAVYGCASLPAISGALALLARRPGRCDQARITLFIGNRNPKGAGAIRAAVEQLGRPIAAPQGTLRGFGGSEAVELPAPFGRRTVFDFDAPEYDLFPSLVETGVVRVKVGFELAAATQGFAFLSRIGGRWGGVTAGLLGAVGRLTSGIGHSGGAVLVELFYADGQPRTASLSVPTDGQRMAALPCAIVAARLAAGAAAPGAHTAYELLGAQQLVDELVRAGAVLAVT